MAGLIDTDARHAQLKKYATWGFVLVAAAVTAPLAVLAIEGLIGWIVAAVLVTLIANFSPVVGTWFANKRIAALIAVVEANPIETMQNLYTEKSGDLETADRNIADFGTEIRNFDDQLGDFDRQYPDEAATYHEISDKMHSGLEAMKVERTTSAKELALFQGQIKKAQAIYRMAAAAQKVVKLSKSAEAEVFAHIKEQVAFDTVRTSLNRAFSNLDMAMDRRKDTAMIAAPATAPKQFSATAVVTDVTEGQVTGQTATPIRRAITTGRR